MTLYDEEGNPKYSNNSNVASMLHLYGKIIREGTRLSYEVKRRDMGDEAKQICVQGMSERILDMLNGFRKFIPEEIQICLKDVLMTDSEELLEGLEQRCKDVLKE